MNKENFCPKIPLKTHIMVNALAYILILFTWGKILSVLFLLLNFFFKLDYSTESVGFFILATYLGLIGWLIFVIISTLLREIFGRRCLLFSEPLKHGLLVYGVSLLISLLFTNSLFFTFLF